MSKRIKILFTIPNFDTAGSGKVVYDLVRGLDSNLFEIELVSNRAGGSFYKTVEQLGLPIHILKTTTHYKPYFSLPFRLFRIARFYRKQRYDLIHSWQWSSDWTEALAAKLAGVKWIYTKKAMGFDSKHWKFKSYLADYIITINDEMQDYFPNKNNQQLIPLGLDTNYYSPSHFERSEGNTSILKIIVVANLVPVKGLEVLLHAIKLLNDPTIRLTVLGKNDNTYGQSMQVLTHDLELSNQVDFLGKQPDVRPYIAQSDLYVIPTLDAGRKEGMPMALVEAMSMGIPVLGSDISGINFVLKDFTPLLFQASNAQVLADKIKYFQSLKSEERRQLGDSLRLYCVAHFSMQAFIKAHELLYKKLISTKEM